jgi:hypothetical protein
MLNIPLWLRWTVFRLRGVDSVSGKINYQLKNHFYGAGDHRFTGSDHHITRPAAILQ